MTSDATSYSAKEGHDVSSHFITEFGCLSLPSSVYWHFALCASVANEYS